MLIGALAANRYRVAPRLTAHVAVLIDGTDDLAALERALAQEGWTVRRSSPEGEVLRLRHADLGLADLLVAGTAYQREAIVRAVRERVGDVDLLVLRAEDVIVHKLIAGRTQDHADIEAIVAARVSLDDAYIERWAAYWDVTADWRRLRSG